MLGAVGPGCGPAVLWLTGRPHRSRPLLNKLIMAASEKWIEVTEA